MRCVYIAISIFLLSTLAEAKESKSIEVIEVVANKSEKSLMELSGSSALITSKELEQMVATQLGDLFKTEPGISVTGYSGRPQNITIRGMSGNRVLIIQDGSRAADGYGASDINDLVGRFNFDLEEVKSIEVAKGPASTFFGSGALAGVVKVNTKQASDYLKHADYFIALKTLYANVNKESKHTLTGALQVADLPVMVKLSEWTANEQQNYVKTRTPLNVTGQSAKLNTQFDVMSNELTYNLNWISQQSDNQYKPLSIPQPDGAWNVKDQQQSELQKTLSHVLKLTSTSENMLFDDASMQLFWRKTQHHNDTEQLISRVFFDVQTRYRKLRSDDLFSQTSKGWSFDSVKSLGTHDLMYGSSYEVLKHKRPKVDLISENGKQKSTSSEPFNAAKTVILGFYLGDDWEINDQLNAILGARYDKNKLSTINNDALKTSSDEATISAQLKYDNNDGFNLYGAYAQGYRAAPYDKVYGNIPHLFAFPPFEIIANTNLEAETSDSLEFGFSKTIDSFQFAGSVFYTRYEDFIDWVNVGMRSNDGVMERQFTNIDEAYTVGFEAELSYQINSFEIGANTGWIRGKNKQKSEYLRNLTPLEYALYVQYASESLSIRAQWYGQDSMDDLPVCYSTFLKIEQPCQTTRGWYNLDLSMSYELSQRWRLNAALNNVLDAHFTRYQDIAGLSESDRDYSQPGRNFRVSVQFQF